MDGYVFLAAGRKNLNVGDNARGLNGFVGQIFQKVFSIVDANHLSCIIDADIERTALSISEATDVGEVFVMPLLASGCSSGIFSRTLMLPFSMSFFNVPGCSSGRSLCGCC